ncbi:MAG: hypothetical protein DRH20_13380 [Deltaproteobacteria bacterium]|nr:MAG: hypothetical protein DRH20_13380 [Deltaproteobacteria bacterium]
MVDAFVLSCAVVDGASIFQRVFVHGDAHDFSIFNRAFKGPGKGAGMKGCVRRQICPSEGFLGDLAGDRRGPPILTPIFLDSVVML